MIRLHVNDKRASEIQQLIELGAARIEKIHGLLESFCGSLDSASVREVFYEGAPKRLADNLFKHGTSLCLLTDDENVTSTEVLDALRRGLERFGWEEEKINEFDEIRKALDKIISSDALYLCAKSIRIFGIDANHLHEFRMFVESRPVFDRGRDTVEADLLYTVLSIFASDASENETRLSVKLGYDELMDVKEECEKALRKLTSYEKSLADSGDRRTIIYGKNDERT